MIVLIPAYEPDTRLLTLVSDLRVTRPDLPVVVVDDGSGPAYATLFATVEEAGATVLRHAVNTGKGTALRTGFAHVVATRPGHGVVCADCDGQHTVDDILAVAERAEHGTGAVVLGARQFTGHVPARSRLGNTCTRWAFRSATGRAIQDTQTGLRAYPARMLPWLLAIRGDRFEYELGALLAAAREELEIEEVPISTVYLDGNAGSHFRPVVDSTRVYAPLLRFTASSLLAFAVDATALLLLMAVTGALLVSVVGARAVSSTVNFLTNRRWVFRQRRSQPVARQAIRYWLLVGTLGVAGYGSLWALTTIGVPLLLAKIGTDLTLFVVGYEVQRTAVFTGRVGPPPAAPAGSLVSPRAQEREPRASASRSPGTAPAVREPRD